MVVVWPGGSVPRRLGATTLYSPQLCPPVQSVPPKLPNPLTNLMPPKEQLALPTFTMVMGSVLVRPTITLPNCSTRPRNPPNPLGCGVTLTLQTGFATGTPASWTESCGRSGSSESNSSAPLSEGLVSLPGGRYCTVAVKASPGRILTADIGGVTTAKYAVPEEIFTAERLQSASPRFATVTSRCELWPRTTCPKSTLEAPAS